MKKALCVTAIVVSSMVVLAVALVSFLPTSLVLVTPGVRSRSPYCSKWRASWDARLKLRQERAQQAFAKASRLIRTEGSLAFWDTPKGRFWIPDQSGAILFILLAQEERQIYGRVKPGGTVLDIGAYIGTWTRQALQQGAGLVVAVEPSPESLECLRRNLASEIAGGRVIVYAKGIWDSEGTLGLFENTSTGAGNSFVEQSETSRIRNGIPVTTIDRMTQELNLGRVDMIKADVKGATERLVRGAATIIQRDGPEIVVSTEEAVDEAAAIANLIHALRPSYQMRCGPCLLDGREIYTDVLFFR